MRKFLQKILALTASLFLWRYKPKVIAITGSVGKTSAKEAIAKVLQTKFKVRASPGNYNNEFGVPLTVIGEISAGRSVFGWFLIFLKALIKFVGGGYPQVLILELGADRPGDIGYLVSLLGKIDAAVITDIGISHLQFFSDQSELAKEKIALIKKLKPESKAILNFDSPKVYEGRLATKAEVVGFGFDQLAAVQVSDFQLLLVDNTWGANFKVHYRGTVVPFFIPNGLGKPVVYAALAAAAVGLSFDINLVNVSEVLKTFEPPAGRLRLIAGIKNTLILDDTYNAAPASTNAALEVLNLITSGRRIVALGSMTELGGKTEAGHREVAARIGEIQPAVIFLVGEETKYIRDELNKRKFGGNMFWYATSDEARLPIQNTISERDTILVKGSQAVRMEKIVKEIMAEPMRADELLVRQSEKWLDQP